VANFSGVGLNLYWIPVWTFLPSYAVPTFIGGGKSLNVTHSTSGTLTSSYGAVTMEKYRYAVQSYEAGCNLDLRLAQHFTIIPWIDYQENTISAPQASAGSTSVGTTSVASATAIDPSLTDDMTLFWKSAPILSYGIDFAVKLDGFEIHLGGLIGILGTLNKGSDRIQDNSRTISVSFEAKGG